MLLLKYGGWMDYWNGREWIDQNRREKDSLLLQLLHLMLIDASRRSPHEKEEKKKPVQPGKNKGNNTLKCFIRRRQFARGDDLYYNFLNGSYEE